MLSAERLGWVGVDVGTRAVKLAQVERDGAGVRLRRAAVIQRPTSWPDHDMAFDQPLSSQQEIVAARQAARFAGRSALCLLPMNVCQLRGLNIPPGDGRERQSMIDDEMSPEWEEQRVAMNFDYWELEGGGPAEKGHDGHNVNVLAVARPWISQLAGDCRRAGLDCWAVDGVPLAMARAVSLADGASGGRRTLAVDWGFSNTTLCVVGDGRAWYTRRVSDCAFGKALDLIGQRLGVTLDQAQHLADAHGIASPQDDESDRLVQTAISDAIDTVLEGLRDQLRRTLQFLELQRRHLHPVAVWLMGGGAALRNVAPWLAEELQLPVHLWQLPSGDESSPAAGNGSALFAGAAALSAMAWRAA